MKAYCINLDIRPRRWRQTKREMKKLNVELIRFPAITGGWSGSAKSHASVLLRAEDNVFMVVEDDVKFIVKDPMRIICNAIAQLPSDWDLLYLGATLNKPVKRYSENLLILKNAQAIHAIVYNNQHNVVEYIAENYDNDIIDLFYMDTIQEKFNCFMTYPMVATQRAGISDNIGKFNSYHGIIKNYKKYTK